jgi:hypothetical protein
MTEMNNDWVQNLKKKISRNAEKEITTAGPYDHDDLSIEEVAARVGVAAITMRMWLCKRLIPTPKRKRGPKPMMKHCGPNRHHFKREYAEALRDCVIIRKSTTDYHSEEAFRDLCYSRLKKFI